MTWSALAAWWPSGRCPAVTRRPSPHLTCLLAPPQGTWTRVRLVPGGSCTNVLHPGVSRGFMSLSLLFNFHEMLSEEIRKDVGLSCWLHIFSSIPVAYSVQVSPADVSSHVTIRLIIASWFLTGRKGKMHLNKRCLVVPQYAVCFVNVGNRLD